MALTVTALNPPDTFVFDLYGEDLFTVQGGTLPFRAAKLTISSSTYARTYTSTVAGGGGTLESLQINGDSSGVGWAEVPVSLQIPESTGTPFQIAANYCYNVSGLTCVPFRFGNPGFYTITLFLLDGSAAPGETVTKSVVIAVYGLDGTVPDPEQDPGDPNNPYTGTIQGTLRLDTSDGAFAARTVYLYNYTTGEKVAQTTSDGTTGEWEFTAVAPGDYFVVGAAQGDDLTVPRDFDALGVITVS